jgi:hypothetical protein
MAGMQRTHMWDMNWCLQALQQVRHKSFEVDCHSQAAAAEADRWFWGHQQQQLLYTLALHGWANWWLPMRLNGELLAFVAAYASERRAACLALPPACRLMTAARRWHMQ